MHSRQGWLGAYFAPEMVKKRCQHEGWQRFQTFTPKQAQI